MPGGWAWDDDEETPLQRRARENGERQIAHALERVEAALPDGRCVVDDALLCALHGLAMDGLIDEPGAIRVDDVVIRGSGHRPPPWQQVRAHLDEFYTYVNQSHHDAIHVAAYTLWRINWIHPFAPDGNGRVSRAVALVVLFARLRRMPPAKVGRPTFLHRLAQQKYAYLDALEAADAAWARSEVDVSALESLLEEVLAQQLGEFDPAAE